MVIDSDFNVGKLIFKLNLIIKYRLKDVIEGKDLRRELLIQETKSLMLVLWHNTPRCHR